MFAKVCQYFSIKYYNLFFDTAQAVLREFFVCARFCLTKANCFRIIKGEFKRRNRLAVWRQLPKLIPTGACAATEPPCGEGTPVSETGVEHFSTSSCRNRLAVWRQLPKLIPTGACAATEPPCGEGTPVSETGVEHFSTSSCRNRLAVWRQLPKLIPAGSTPVSCSTNKRHACVPFFFLCYMIPTKYCGESNRTDISFSPPPRDTVITTLSFFRTLNRKSLSLCMRVKYTVRSSRGALSPSRRG